jgi:hypothetical protein
MSMFMLNKKEMESLLGPDKVSAMEEEALASGRCSRAAEVNGHSPCLFLKDVWSYKMVVTGYLGRLQYFVFNTTGRISP